MPTNAHLVSVAKSIKNRINGKAFESIPRMEITDLLRRVSGEDTTRLKKTMSEDLERKLLEQGVRVFPRLQETSTGDTVRVFHTGTVVASLVDMLASPSPDTDWQLAGMTNKVKSVQNVPRPDHDIADKLDEIINTASLGSLYAQLEALISEIREEARPDDRDGEADE